MAVTGVRHEPLQIMLECLISEHKDALADKSRCEHDTQQR